MTAPSNAAMDAAEEWIYGGGSGSISSLARVIDALASAQSAALLEALERADRAFMNIGMADDAQVRTEIRAAIAKARQKGEG